MTHGYENPQFIDLIKCFVDQKCLDDYPRDGICKGSDEEAVQTITSLDQVAGDWWVVRGLNCGKGDYPGGYDGKWVVFLKSIPFQELKQNDTYFGKYVHHA